jgi:hypothetical protein
VDEKNWLEPVLREGLGRVRAPQELWNRIQASPCPILKRSAERPGYRLLWSLAGASVVTASVLAVAWGSNPARLSPNSASARQLHRCRRRYPASPAIRMALSEMFTGSTLSGCGSDGSQVPFNERGAFPPAFDSR